MNKESQNIPLLPAETPNDLGNKDCKDVAPLMKNATKKYDVKKGTNLWMCTAKAKNNKSAKTDTQASLTEDSYAETESLISDVETANTDETANTTTQASKIVVKLAEDNHSTTNKCCAFFLILFVLALAGGIAYLLYYYTASWDRGKVQVRPSSKLPSSYQHDSVLAK